MLILTASVGTGHNAAARALAGELGRLRPDLDVQRLDILDYARSIFSFCYAGGFKLGMTRFPRTYGLGFRLTNRPHRPGRGLLERPRLWQERLMLAPLGEKIIELQPDLIINTHFLQGPLIRRMQQRGEISCRQCVVATDVEIHRWWYAQDVAHWFLPQQRSREIVSRWEVPEERITVSGIPIEPKWQEELDRAAIRKKWQLPPRCPVALLSGGAEFTVGPILKIAENLLEACPKLQLIALAGRNKRLLARLGKLAANNERLIPVGFTDCMHELVEIADVMVTKAGGITTSECLCKGTPMVLINPVPGQEGGNAEFFQQQGAALIARGSKKIVSETARLIHNPDRIARMSRACLDLYHPGRQIIAEQICALLDSPPNRD